MNSIDCYSWKFIIQVECNCFCRTVFFVVFTNNTENILSFKFAIFSWQFWFIDIYAKAARFVKCRNLWTTWSPVLQIIWCMNRVTSLCRTVMQASSKSNFIWVMLNCTICPVQVVLIVITSKNTDCIPVIKIRNAITKSSRNCNCIIWTLKDFCITSDC